jgi:hypothetical protein
MSTVPKPQTTRRRPRLVLRYVDWKTYTRLVRVFNERPGVRLTYDRGKLVLLCEMIVASG